LGTKFHVKWST